MSDNLTTFQPTTSRSQIETYQKCPRLAYWQYYHEGRGLDLDGSAVALNIGSCAHRYAELCLTRPELAALDVVHQMPEYAALERDEDRDLVNALCMTWFHFGQPALQGWHIDSVEREEHFDAHGVRFQSRSDWVATAPANTYLNGLPVVEGTYVWNLKTYKNCDERKRKTVLYDPQVFTEIPGPEARLGQRLAGVVYQVLVKENHPLVWAWRSPRSGQIAYRYAWRCDSSHENTHTKSGGFCAGGKFHRLGDDWTKVPVRELPGGQAAHCERILEVDPTILADYHVILGPMQRASDYVIDEWCEMHLPQQAALAALPYPQVGVLDEQLLRQHFPKRTAHANCLYPGECSAFNFCYGAADPNAFEYRQPNHPAVGGDTTS